VDHKNDLNGESSQNNYDYEKLRTVREKTTVIKGGSKNLTG
jgi:hypothetical protein